MRVVLGVGGGIAAYKCAELARLLAERGCTVQVVMTAAATRFIAPLTLAALTGRKVITGLFDDASPEDIVASSVEHIRVAQENDVLVVAPATADLIARLAHGLAGDFLTTMYLAFTGPVVVAPAMNANMWNHEATRRNVETLAARGHVVVPPDDGPLACGMVGPGRLAEPEAIVGAVLAAGNPRRDLEGETVLITAGPTQEALDPVRYISNRSSGRMGYALAEAAAARGANVILVSGPVAIDSPRGVTLVKVRSAVEMRQAVLDNLEPATIVIKSAAVADYHLEHVPGQKIKKTAMRLSLELSPTPDILAEVGRLKEDRILVGFAAETQNMVSEARRKMETKNCDMVVGNLVSTEGIGFESADNEVTLVPRSGEPVHLAKAPKRRIADQILDQVGKIRLSLHAAAPAGEKA
ncbi:MAG: bifunctional phosphopantothenoylcysteine decarboxylase/phosphopantothenate--cysteine ligase CoaBC [Bryobacteraceae bacterium]